MDTVVVSGLGLDATTPAIAKPVLVKVESIVLPPLQVALPLLSLPLTGLCHPAQTYAEFD